MKCFILSAYNMALLAEELCSCKAELVSGGLSGSNAATIIAHLWARQPVLIPYPRKNPSVYNLWLCFFN